MFVELSQGALDELAYGGTSSLAWHLTRSPGVIYRIPCTRVNLSHARCQMDVTTDPRRSGEGGRGLSPKDFKDLLLPGPPLAFSRQLLSANIPYLTALAA